MFEKLRLDDPGFSEPQDRRDRVSPYLSAHAAFPWPCWSRASRGVILDPPLLVVALDEGSHGLAAGVPRVRALGHPVGLRLLE